MPGPERNCCRWSIRNCDSSPARRWRGSGRGIRSRRPLRAKRGGGAEHCDVEAIETAAPEGRADELLRVHEVLDQLAAEDPQKAELVNLRFFAGLTLIEAATVLGLSERTAKRHWAYARAWLFDALQQNGNGGVE